jgi:NADH-quinone oxidoreductase subunit C
VRAPAPAWAADLNGDTMETLRSTLGDAVLDMVDQVGEIALYVERDSIAATLTRLRDTPGLEYQQLMEIAGVDYPERAERFEVVYCLLSLTRNHRLHVHVATDEVKPVPSVTGIWPVAGWLEREIYDLYGVLFTGNADLRRILTDYGFRGHPLRKDFPMTGFVEMRYSEEAKRVIYEPVKLAQDFRNFDFQSPWEGAQYVLPGDEKGSLPEAKGAPTPLKADTIVKADVAQSPTKAPAAGSEPYGKNDTQGTATTGAGDADPGNQRQDKPKDPDVVPAKGGGQNQ